MGSLWINRFFVVREGLLELTGQVFSTHLIVLDGQGIDVILGMSWMNLNKAMLDIAKQLVFLYSPIYGNVILHFPVIVHLRASMHHIVAKNIEEIHVVREFPDVFLDDLPGKPPERDIGFKIDLRFGTAPITKRTYIIT
jgi:hypothetical protein